MPTQLLELARYLTRPRAQARDDRQAADELNWQRARPPNLPRGLSMTWLGTSGFAFTYEGYTLLIDPYVTRVPLRVALGRAPARPDRARIDRHVPRADAILIGHTHFDHVMDAPVIAARDGCHVYGSASLVTLMAAHGLRERAVEVDHFREYELGPFKVCFVPSVHSKLALGWAIPASGEIDAELTCEHFDGLACSAYRCGQVFGLHVEVAGTSFYHQGSADLIEDAIRHRDVDVFLAGIAGRGFTASYTRRALHALRPACVLPHHHDDFFVDLDAPMRFSFNVNFAGFVDEVHAVSREIGLVALAPMQAARG